MAEPTRTHRHSWTGVDFYLYDGRPMLRQTCACGAERQLRAFERYWDGGGTPSSTRSPIEPPSGSGLGVT